MQAGAAATERLLDATKLDHAGGGHRGWRGRAGIGALIALKSWPMARLPGVSAQLGDLPPRGRLVTSDRLVTGLDEAAELKQSGVVGLDMETAAIAAVCERRGCPWSVFRAISDRVSDGTTDPAVLALAGPDGRGDARAVARYLLARPWRMCGSHGLPSAPSAPPTRPPPPRSGLARASPRGTGTFLLVDVARDMGGPGGVHGATSRNVPTLA
jgi:hypothetical protein